MKFRLIRIEDDADVTGQHNPCIHHDGTIVLLMGNGQWKTLEDSERFRVEQACDCGKRGQERIVASGFPSFVICDECYDKATRDIVRVTTRRVKFSAYLEIIRGKLGEKTFTMKIPPDDIQPFIAARNVIQKEKNVWIGATPEFYVEDDKTCILFRCSASEDTAPTTREHCKGENNLER